MTKIQKDIIFLFIKKYQLEVLRFLTTDFFIIARNIS